MTGVNSVSNQSNVTSVTTINREIGIGEEEGEDSPKLTENYVRDIF